MPSTSCLKQNVGLFNVVQSFYWRALFHDIFKHSRRNDADNRFERRYEWQRTPYEEEEEFQFSESRRSETYSLEDERLPNRSYNNCLANYMTDSTTPGARSICH